MSDSSGPDRASEAPTGKVQPIPDRIWVEFGRELTEDGSHQIESREVVDGPDATPDYPYQETAEYVRAPAWAAGTVVGDAIAKLQRLSAEQEESLQWEAAQRPAVRVGAPVDPKESAMNQTLTDAENLCRSEANRWRRADPGTAAHWQTTADDLAKLNAWLAFDEARRAVQPLVKQILESENVGDVMDMRLDVAAPEEG